MELIPHPDTVGKNKINGKIEIKSKQNEQLSKNEETILDFNDYIGITDDSESSVVLDFKPYNPNDNKVSLAISKPKMPDTKDAQSVIEFFHLTGDIDDYEIKKDKNGNITDIYRKKAEHVSLDTPSLAERFSLRYDANGNVIKSFIQDIDKNGKVLGQEIKNYNEDGSLKNTAYYRYQFDEDGNQIGQNLDIVDAKYGDEFKVLTLFGLGYSELPRNVAVQDTMSAIGVLPLKKYEGVDNVQKNNKGQITDLTYNGVRYSLRYDADGNLTKTMVQQFDDDGKISSQKITNIKADGTKVQEVRTYDKNGVDNTSESQKAINKVFAMYVTKTGDINKSQDAFNKFQSFIENNTMEKLKAAGVSNEAIQALLDNLFKNIDEKLYSKQFSGTESEKQLIARYKEQYQKVFENLPMLMYMDSIKTD